jgi:RecA-family ATPase
MKMCDEIDKRIRKFVWGSTTEKRKNTPCKMGKAMSTKGRGGRVLTSTKNDTKTKQGTLDEIDFGVLTKPNEFWVQVLREIYYEFLKNKVILKGKRQLFYMSRVQVGTPCWHGPT